MVSSDEKPESGLSLKSNVIWNTAGNFIYLGSQWLFTYIVVRLLGFEQAGIFSLAMTIATSFAALANYNMRTFQSSDIRDEYSDMEYIVSRVITCAVAFLFCCLFSILNGYQFEVIISVLLFMIFKIVEALSDVYQGLLQKNMRLDFVGKSFIGKGLCTLIVFSSAIFYFRDLNLALILIDVVVVFVLVFYDARKTNEIRIGLFAKKAFSFKRVFLLLSICLPLAIFGFFINAIGQLPRYFVEMILGETALGYYASIAMPVMIVQVSASFIFAPLVTPLAKSLNEGKKQEFFSLVKKVFIFLAILSAIAIIVAWIAGTPLLVIMFGADIEPHAYLLMPLVGCTIATSCAWLLSSILTIVRRRKELIVYSGISLGFVILTCSMFIHWFGMNGASYNLLIALIAFSIGCIFSIRKHFANQTMANQE